MDRKPHKRPRGPLNNFFLGGYHHGTSPRGIMAMFFSRCRTLKGAFEVYSMEGRECLVPTSVEDVQLLVAASDILAPFI